MSFDYEESKAQVEEEESVWASYSDLYTQLAVVFLLLFVVATLRQSTLGIQKYQEYQKIIAENEDLKQQIRTYDVLKEDYLEKTASSDEQELYQELMSKLDLLEEEARKEKLDLRQQALENEKKEKALNKYQQAIRNVIQANMVAQARIKRRDRVIEEKEKSLAERIQDIKSLQTTVDEKQRIIASGEREMQRVSEALNQKVKELERSYQQQKITKKRMQEEVKKVREVSQRRIAELKEANDSISQELTQASQEIEEINSQLTTTQQQLESQAQERAELMSKMEQTQQKYQQQRAELEKEFTQKMAAEREAFEQKMAQAQVSSQKRIEMEKQFREAAEKKEADLAKKIANLKEKIGTSEKELAKARAQANARRELAKKIAQGFKEAGVDADVNIDTGDVTMSFGDEYFDTGKASLKTGMRSRLEKLIPIYSASLFGDKKTADKIQAVEIIGFASPTYGGKFVDPESLDPKDRAAVNYNLDLSFNRAKAIFNHSFDTTKLTFPHQKQLQRLVKVTGRSFLAEDVRGRGVASGIDEKEYCSRFKCEQAQRVIIKFNLKD